MGVGTGLTASNRKTPTAEAFGIAARICPLEESLNWPDVSSRRKDVTGPSVIYTQTKSFNESAELTVEINRNQYFMIGVVLLALGIQFRMVDSVTLTQEASHFLAKRFAAKKAEPSDVPTAFVAAAEDANVVSAKKTIKPPQWLGWALISMGAVLVLHSLAMPKPG